MGKYDEFIKKQKNFINEIESSKNGINHTLYCELVRLDRQSISNMLFIGDQEKYIENGKQYNLYREQGFAYKYTFVCLCDFLVKNGFQLPTQITEKYNSLLSDIDVYKKELEEKGSFEFSTIKYILAVDLGLREQMKLIFSGQIINEDVFPKFETTKQSLETISMVFKDTKRRYIIANFTTDELKATYITAMGQRLTELEAQLLAMKEKIEKEGVFSLDNHPQYKKFVAEYNSLSQKISEISAIVDPQEIERLRANLLDKVIDYKAQYEQLTEGKNIKGDQNKETLESEKKFYEDEVKSFSPGGDVFKTVADTMSELNSDMVNYSNEKIVFSELKALLDKYENQNQNCATAKINIQNKENELSTIQREYEKKATAYFKMLFIQKHTKKGKENEAERIELRKQERAKKTELQQTQTIEKNENEKLDKIKEEILKKIEELQKDNNYKKYFQSGMPGRTIDFEIRLGELKKCITELNKSLFDLDVKISDERTKIDATVNMSGTPITSETVRNKMTQIVVEGQKKVESLDKALNYTNIEEQQPDYYNNLEIGIELAEEEISSRKK